MRKLILLSSILFLGGCSSVDIPDEDIYVDTSPEFDLDDYLDGFNDECCDEDNSYHQLLLSYVFIDVVNLNKIDLPSSIMNESITWSNSGSNITSLIGGNTTYYIKATIGNVSKNFNVTFSNNQVKQIYQQDLIFHYHFITYAPKLGTSMNPNTIVIHNTANTASAYNEIMYLNSTENKTATSYHYAVDDIGIYQGVASNIYAHHAGNINVNKESIGIEIAKSLLTDNAIKDKAIYNAQRLIRLLQMQYNIDNIITHKDVTGKHCPHDIYDRYTIDRFYNELFNMYNII